jgi:hypothetical protein
VEGKQLRQLLGREAFMSSRDAQQHSFSNGRIDRFEFALDHGPEAPPLGLPDDREQRSRRVILIGDDERIDPRSARLEKISRATRGEVDIPDHRETGEPVLEPANRLESGAAAGEEIDNSDADRLLAALGSQGRPGVTDSESMSVTNCILHALQMS